MREIHYTPDQIGDMTLPELALLGLSEKPEYPMHYIRLSGDVWRKLSMQQKLELANYLWGTSGEY